MRKLEIKCHLGFKVSQEPPWGSLLYPSHLWVLAVGPFYPVTCRAECVTHSPVLTLRSSAPASQLEASLLFCPQTGKVRTSWPQYHLGILLSGTGRAHPHQSGCLCLSLMRGGFWGQGRRREESEGPSGLECVQPRGNGRGQPAKGCSNPNCHQRGFHHFASSFRLAEFYFTDFSTQLD